MKRWAIIAGAAVVAIVAIVVVLKMMGGETKPVVETRVEKPTGPDPARLAKVAELFKQLEDAEAKGEFKDAVFTLNQLQKLEPNDARLPTFRPRLEEKLKRFEAWDAAHRRAVDERKEATRLNNTTAGWKKVLDSCAEAGRQAPTEKQQKLTRELIVVATQYRDWAAAREEEGKGNLAAAIDLAGQALAAPDPPAELAAYKTSLEKKKRKLEFDRAAAAARAEGAPVKAYELWQKARPLAEDPKDVAEVDAKLDALKPWVDPAERERRYGDAMKSGEAALAAGDLDAAEKAFKSAQTLKVTELAPGQALTRVSTARRLKGFDTAIAEAKGAEEKKQWADAIEAYDRALRVKADSTITARRKELEEQYRPPKIVIPLSEGSGVRMEFVLIKRGKFLMGDAQGNSDEKPHEVVIEKDFWMQTTELTQAHWMIVMNTKPWMSNSVPHLPVEGVSWEDTQKFFEKFNATLQEPLKGRKGSLPTEAEWEYACRAGTKTRWSYGNDEGQFDQYGWCSGSKVRGPQPVGQKSPNPWGLFDMHGNVAEWCADGYAGYGEKAADDPQFRCYRGGSWNDRVENCRSSKREKDLPTKSNLFLGFRAVLR
jgi:formylglycine-generating enzyme required for sulfatase activity